MSSSNKRKLTPYEAVALCAAEVLSETQFKEILARAHERVRPDMLGHDWNNAQVALLTHLWAKQGETSTNSLEQSGGES
jgi:hypothetical protein